MPSKNIRWTSSIFNNNTYIKSQVIENTLRFPLQKLISKKQMVLMHFMEAYPQPHSVSRRITLIKLKGNSNKLLMFQRIADQC